MDLSLNLRMMHFFLFFKYFIFKSFEFLIVMMNALNSNARLKEGTKEKVEEEGRDLTRDSLILKEREANKEIQRQAQTFPCVLRSER